MKRLTTEQKTKVKKFIKNLKETKKIISEMGDNTQIFEKLPWNEITKYISEHFKIPGLKLEYILKGDYVKIKSSNLIKYCGIFSTALGECYIDFFNSSLTDSPDEDYYFWGTISLSYPGNGLKVATVWITKDFKVVYKKDNPRMD